MNQFHFFLFLVVFTIVFFSIYLFCKYALGDVIEAATILPRQVERLKRRMSRRRRSESLDNYTYPRHQMRIILMDLERNSINLSIQAKNTIYSFLPPPLFCTWSPERSGPLLSFHSRQSESYHIPVDKNVSTSFECGSQNVVTMLPIPEIGVHTWEIRYESKCGTLKGGHCVGAFACVEPPPSMLFPKLYSRGGLYEDLCDQNDFIGIHERSIAEQEEAKNHDNDPLPPSTTNDFKVSNLFDSGDIVRVKLDRNFHTMQFWVNGKRLELRIHVPSNKPLYIVASPYMRETRVYLMHIQSEF